MSSSGIGMSSVSTLSALASAAEAVRLSRASGLVAVPASESVTGAVSASALASVGGTATLLSGAGWVVFLRDERGR
jgi:hypothetical protein